MTMTPVEAVLDGLNRKHGFLASILVHRDRYVLALVGDPRQPAWDDPWNLHFRDAAAIAVTFDYLDHEKAPRARAQGTREVLLFQPFPNVVLGSVKDDPRGAVEMFKLAMALAPELPALLAGLDLDD